MCTKECILIIDRNTGEAILERISDTVQLKAIRSEIIDVRSTFMRFIGMFLWVMQCLSMDATTILG